MALVDIPERDSLDGAAQLLRLRAYLKDSDANDYEFPDDFLIALLVLNERNFVWRSLLNIPELTEDEIDEGMEPTIAFSYDPDNPQGFVSTVRALTVDTIEVTLKHTNYKISSLIEVMPLKRVVQAIKIGNSEDKTMPVDINHPLRIIRELIDDTVEGSMVNTDWILMSSMIDSEQNPYEYVIAIIDKSIAIGSAEKGQEVSGGFAAIDGISFSADKIDGSIETAQSHRDVVVGKMGSSIYNKADDFAVFCDGLDVSTGDIGAWYAV